MSVMSLYLFLCIYSEGLWVQYFCSCQNNNWIFLPLWFGCIGTIILLKFTHWTLSYLIAVNHKTKKTSFLTCLYYRTLKGTLAQSFSLSWSWSLGGHLTITQIGGKNMCIAWVGYLCLTTVTTTVLIKTGIQLWIKHQGTKKHLLFSSFSWWSTYVFL